MIDREEDSRALLRVYQAWTGLAAPVPALTLPTIIQEVLRWKILPKALPFGMRGLTDPCSQTIWLSDTWHKVTRSPGTIQEQLHWILAHELGHLRLHLHQLIDGKKCNRREEEEADWYAGEFLMPYESLIQHTEFWMILKNKAAPYWLKAKLADSYCVTVAALIHRLNRIAKGMTTQRDRIEARVR